MFPRDKGLRDLQGPLLGVAERSWSLHSGLGSIPGLGTILKQPRNNLVCQYIFGRDLFRFQTVKAVH